MTHAIPSRSLLAASLGMAAACFFAYSAAAQTLEDLKKQDSRLIDWMKEKNASEVMEYYGKAYPSKDEKTLVSLRIATAKAKIESSEAILRTASGEEQNKLFAQMRAATEELLAAQRDRCEKFGTDDSAVLWQMDLLSNMVDNYLRRYRRNAVDVYEYGAPDADQVKAYEEWFPQAFVQANRAMTAADHVQKRMLGDRRYSNQLTKMGLKNKLQDAQVTIKFWLGSTAYGMTLLPDTHPYFANLGKPGSIVVPGQKTAVADERKRLLALAEEVSADSPALAARVLCAQGKYKEAKAKVDAIRLDETESALDAARIIAAKGKVAAASGALDEAVKVLRADALKTPAIAADLAEKNSSARPYLFVCDAAHRLLMDASKTAKPPQDVELFNKAFMDPYADVFADKPLEDVGPEAAAAIRNLRPELTQRWQKQFASLPPEKLPAFVATGTITLEMGELLAPGGPWAQAKEAAEKKEAPDAAKIKALTEKMHRIEKGLEAFTTHPVKAVRAKMLDQLALLRFLGAQAGVFLVADPKINIAAADQTAHAAAMNWLTIADELSETSQAGQAMDYAAMIMRAQQDAGVYTKEYLKCCEVLFAKYPKSKAALRELTKYAEILAGQGKYDAAEKILGQMPKEDNFYFVAQQKAVSLKDRKRKSLQAVAEAAKADGTPSPKADADFNAALDAVIKSASDLVDDAKKAAKEAPGYRRASAVSVRASTLALLANAYAAKGNAQQGVALLEPLEAEFTPTALKVEDFDGNAAGLENMQKALASQVEWAQICRMRMLMDAGLGDQVKTRAEQLLGSGNAKSVGVLRGLLRDLKLEVDRLKDEIAASKFGPHTAELSTKRQRYGKAMLDLTDLLRTKLMPTANEQERDYLNTLLVLAKCASGDTAGGVALAKQLQDEMEQAVVSKKRTSRSLNLILCAAQANFDHAKSFADPDSKERRSLLIEANKSAKRIADNFRAAAPGPEGYPTEFYEAFWIHLSAIEALPVTSEKIRELRRNIPTAIKSIQETDPKGFGDLPWNDRFEKLMLRIQVEK